MFRTYYNSKRFKFLEKKFSAWKTSGFIKQAGPEVIRKTMVFKGRKGNFYIDTSDGVNEDLGVDEYCGRILRIIEDSKDKRFLVFKTSYSPLKTAKMKQIARDNGGDVLPFFIMCYYPDFYDHTKYQRDKFLTYRKQVKRKYDIGFCSDLKPYKFPKPAIESNLYSWLDRWYFGLGSGKHTGYYKITTRKDLYDKLTNSKFKFYHHNKLSFDEYIRKSFEWKVCLNPPGVGEYTGRILEHSAIGQAVVLRKSSYDNAISYKSYFPEIDFNKEDWQDDLQKVIDKYEYWEDRALRYYDKVYSNKNTIIDYIHKKLTEYDIC